MVSFVLPKISMVVNIGNLLQSARSAQIVSHAFFHRTVGVGVSPDLFSVGQNLKTSSSKDENNYEWLFGIHPISCALAAKRRTVHAVFYRKDLLDRSSRIKDIVHMCQESNVQALPVTRNKLDGLLRQQNAPHQGILAKVSQLYYTPLAPCTLESVRNLIDSSDNSNKVWLLLNDIQDPMNFGSILRSSHFLGVDKIFVSSKNSCSLTPVVSKASSGAMELISVHSVASVTSFCQILRTLGWDVVATEPPSQLSNDSSTSTPLLSFIPSNSTLIILGNEGKGLPNDVVEMCSHKVFVESRQRTATKNQIDSMNVSAAAAVILHHLLNARG